MKTEKFNLGKCFGKFAGKPLLIFLSFLKKTSYHILTLISLIVFVIVACAFLFFVFIKTDPKRASLFTTNALNKILPIVRVHAEGISTQINNENILIIIPHFERLAKDAEIEGFNSKIAFSISDILHGRLYKITIEKFLMNIDTRKTTNNSSHSLGNFYYSLIPSLKINITDFILNLNNNKIHLNDALLRINQKGYILYIQANSKQYNYQFKVTLNAKNLHISFQNLPSSLLHKYTENKLDFLNFNSATGFIFFDAKDARNSNFEIFLQKVIFPKGKFINESTTLGDVTIFGSSGVDSLSVITSPFIINGKSSASVDFRMKGGEKEISFDVKNIEVSDVRRIFALKAITAQPVKGVIQYLEQTLKGGYVTKVDGKIQLPMVSSESMLINIGFRNGIFEYHPAFAVVEEGIGNVEIMPSKTTVTIDSGKSAGNILKNSKVEVLGSKVTVTVNTNGTAKSLVDIFKKDYLAYTPLSANIIAKTVLEVPYSCTDVYHCMKIVSSGSIDNLTSEFNDVAASGTFLLEKHANENASFKMDFKNFKNEHIDVNTLQVDIVSLNDYRNLELKIDARSSNGDEVFAKSVKINTNTTTLDGLNLSTIKFKKNNLSFKYTPSSIDVRGESANLPEIYKLITRFSVIKSILNPSQKTSTDTMKLNLLMGNITMYNGVEAFAIGDIDMRKRKLHKALIDSEILSFHYFTPEAEKNASQETLEQGMFIDVPDFSMLVSALSASDMNIFKSGSAKIHGKRMPEGEIIWSGTVDNLHINSEKFKLNTKKIKILATQSGNEISFKNLKVQDANHTVFITGKIFTDTMTIKAKVFYTPSKMEALNEIPFIRDAIKVTSFGTSQNGILSLEIDVTGSVFAPEVRFNKASPIKSLWKIIVSIPYLPFLVF